MGLSQPELAETLELQIGTVLCYENGLIPVPKVVELALEALEKRSIKEIPKTQTLTTVEIRQIIETARNAELRRDINCLENIFGNLSLESEISKTFDNYTPDIRAELLRLYGFFLSAYGQAKNKKNYHSAALDVLTTANKIFTDLKNAPKVAETNVQIAFCYWNAGEIENCKAFLELSEFDFYEDKFHQVYLRTKISQMMLLCWLRKLPESFAIFNELLPIIKDCDDIRLQALFYGEAGILLQIKKDYHEAIFYLNEAIKVTKENNNNLLLALNYNELSLLYLELRVFTEAHLFSDKSLEILEDDQQTGWIPHILDSKALILLEEKNYDQALTKAEEALIYFYQGEDYKGLVGSLWTRVLCLLRLGKNDEAIFTYGQLQQIATVRLGETTARRFAADFVKELYPIRNLPLDQEVNELEKMLLSRALIKTNGAKVKAAELLKLKSHQALSYILKQRHPHLYAQLGFAERSPRRTPNRRGGFFQTKSIKIKSKTDFVEVDLQGKEISFDFKFKKGDFKAYFLDSVLMSSFGVEGSAVVVARTILQPKGGMPVIVLFDNKITVSKITYDSNLDLYLIYDENGEFIFFDEEYFIGEPVGFCLLDDMFSESIQFSKL